MQLSSSRIALAYVCCLFWLWLAPVVAGRIEADPRKVYTVTKQHGPWMIMVTSLRGDTTESVTAANKAARELVLELRKNNIPAYVYAQRGELEEIESIDREGHPTKRFVAAQRNRISVLAGNYNNTPDQQKLAQDTLAWIKNFRPQSLAQGVYRATPGRPGPLSRAFLTMNPLLSEDEIRLMANRQDPLLKMLNNDRKYNLVTNPGQYTLVVRTFQGVSKHVVTGDRKQEVKAIFDFDNQLSKQITLDDAAENAWKLTLTLRQQEKLEAWVFHDQYRSIVTVGSFNDPNDPRIAQLQKKFGAKTVRDPRTQQEVIVVENIELRDSGKGKSPVQGWMFDAFPQLIKVPRID